MTKPMTLCRSHDIITLLSG